MKKLLFVAVLLTAGFVGQVNASSGTTPADDFKNALIDLVTATLKATDPKNNVSVNFCDKSGSNKIPAWHQEPACRYNNQNAPGFKQFILLLQALSNSTSGSMPLAGNNGYLMQITNFANLQPDVLYYACERDSDSDIAGEYLTAGLTSLLDTGTVFTLSASLANLKSSGFQNALTNLVQAAINLNVPNFKYFIALLENLSNGEVDMPLDGDNTGKVNNYLYQINNHWNLSNCLKALGIAQPANS